MSEENPSFVAAVRLLDVLESENYSEVAFILHADRENDSIDCNMYVSQNSQPVEQHDILMDSFSLKGAEMTCRTLKQTLFAVLSLNVDVAAYEQVFRFAGYSPPRDVLRASVLGSFRSQALQFLPLEAGSTSGQATLDDLIGKQVSLSYGAESKPFGVASIGSVVLYSPSTNVAERVELSELTSGKSDQILRADDIISSAKFEHKDPFIAALGTYSGAIAISGTGRESRYVLVEPSDPSSEKLTRFSPWSFWGLMTDYGITREELPAFLFEVTHSSGEH